jgi:High potential iron-sulfur protein
MRDDKLSRRGALKVLGAAPLLGSVLSVGLSACGKKTEPDSCSDVSALSEPEKMARSALQYNDKSPQADQRCELCSLYQPAADTSQCGTCQIVKGPIHPKGHCTGFVAKPPA